MCATPPGTPVYNDQYRDGKILAAYDSPKHGYLCDVVVAKAGEEFVLHSQKMDDWKILD